MLISTYIGDKRPLAHQTFKKRVMIYKNIKELSQEISNNGRLLGLDIGTKRIGVAISDSSRLIANPKLIIDRKSNQKDFLIIKDLIIKNQICALVIGLPINIDESENQMTIFVKKFTDLLDQFLVDVKIAFFDERLSSFAAKEINLSEFNSNFKNKPHYDDIAASLILQDAINNMSKKF